MDAVQGVSTSSPSARKREAVQAFLDELMKQKNYHDCDKVSLAPPPPPGEGSGPYSLHDFALDQSLMSEANRNTSVLALCAAEPSPQDLITAYGSLSQFVQARSSPGLEVVVFPLFANCFLELLLKTDLTTAKDFSSRYLPTVPEVHRKEAEELVSALLSPQASSPSALSPSSLLERHRGTACPVRLSDLSFKHLLSFLQSQPNTVLLSLIQSHIIIEVYGTLQSVQGDGPVEAKKTAQKKKETSVKGVGCGPPSDAKRDTLSNTSTAKPDDFGPPPTSLEEFRQRIKEATHLSPALPSVLMYSSPPGLTCCCLDDDSGRLIGGFEDSTIHVWCLDNGDGVAGQQPIDWESLTGAVASSEGIPHPITPSNHTVLRGHSGPVYSLECTQNGRHMLSASEDSSVRLWDLTHSECVASYQGHAYPVFDVALSPVEVYFATASMDRTARLWSCDSVYPIRVFAGHNSAVDVVRFHPNCNYLATGSSDRTCRLWDVQSGHCVRLFSGTKHSVRCLSFSGDGRSLFAGSEGGEVHQWDIAQGAMMAEYQGLTAGVVGLSLVADGQRLVAASCSGEVCQWACQGGGEEGTERTLHPAPCCRPSLKVKLARTVVKDLSSTYLNRIVLLCSQQTKPAHPTGVV